MIKKENNQKFYTITMSLQKDPFIIMDLFRAGTFNIAYEMFVDKHTINRDDVVSYKIVCCGELRDMGHNPYSFGKCNWQVFEYIKQMPLDQTIKIASIKTTCYYSPKTIGEALRTIERDGYIKHEPINAMGERTYYKKGQVKNELQN